MSGLARWVVCAVLLGSAGGAAWAAEGDAVATVAVDTAVKADLLPLLEEVSRSSGKKFLVADKVPARVAAQRADTGKLSYPLLLSILRNNGLAAVTVQRVVNIVPVETVRAYALPLVDADDADIADDEWVMRVVTLKNAEAAQLVPILRPMVAQAGHLAAVMASNAMLIVDRYGNSRKIAALLAEFDRLPQRASPGAPKP